MGDGLLLAIEGRRSAPSAAEECGIGSGVGCDAWSREGGGRCGEAEYE